MLSCMDWVRTSSTISSRSWTRLRSWFWTFPSSAEYLPPSVMNCTGCRLRGVYVTRSLFLSGTASLGWHRSNWCSCAVRWAGLPADNPWGPPLLVTLSFQDTDSKGRATGPLQFLVLNFGTHFRSKLDGSSDNLMLFKKKLKTHFFQQSWALLWIHF